MSPFYSEETEAHTGHIPRVLEPGRILYLSVHFVPGAVKAQGYNSEKAQSPCPLGT